MSMNDRSHWRVKARDTAAIRAEVCLRARSLRIPPCQKARIQLFYAPIDGRRRDAINLAPTLKACEDGLVDAKVIPDDTPQYLVPVMPLIVFPSRPPMLWLEIDQIL